MKGTEISETKATNEFIPNNIDGEKIKGNIYLYDQL